MPTPSETTALAFVAAINAVDLDALRALMTNDHTFTDARGNRFSGAETMISGWQHFLHIYPDYRIVIEQIFQSANQVALFGHASGKWRVDDRVLPQAWNVSAAWLADITTRKVRTWSVFCDTSWANPPH
ncbi:MAG: nuclear transport factor 2 family protein [Acidobacteriaceae bacterium]